MIAKVYGGYRECCLANGLAPHAAHRPQLYTRESLIEPLLDFYATNKRLPYRGDFGYGRMPSAVTYERRFGNLENAFEAAGLGLVRNGTAVVPSDTHAAD